MGIELNNLYGGWNDLYGQTATNCKIVTPGDNLQTAYDWLKSSDRDVAMGALTFTNRRTLILSAGTYSIAYALTLDTNFVDVVGLGSATIERSDAGAAIYQTAADVRLEGIECMGSNHNTSYGLLVKNEIRGTAATVATAAGVITLTKASSGIGNAARDIDATEWPDEVYIWGGSTTAGWYTVKASSSADAVVLLTAPTDSAGDVNFSYCPQQSIYRRCKFNTRYLIANGGAAAFNYGACVSRGHFSGQWYDCEGGHNSFRCHNYSGFDGQSDSALAVTLANEAASLGGAGNYAVTLVVPEGHGITTQSALIIPATVTGYKNSLGVRVTAFTATTITIEHYETAVTPAGTEVISVRNNWMRAMMHRCKALAYSYCGDGAAALAGELYDCVARDYAFAGCDTNGSSIAGILKRCKAGNNSYAIACGIWPGALLEDCVGGNQCFAGAGGIATTAGRIGGILRRCWCTGCAAGNNGAFGWTRQATGTKASWYGIYAGGILEDCRIGTAAELRAGTYDHRAAYQEFSGVCRNNFPSKTVSRSSATTLREFDSGGTFTNSANMTYTLPAAYPGLKYRFIVGFNALTIDPNGTDTTEKDVNTASSGAGKYITSATVGDWIELECFVAGAWRCTGASAAWTAE